MSRLTFPRSAWGSTFDYAARHRARPANPHKVEVVFHHSVTIAPDLVPPFDDEYRAMRTLEDIGESRFGSGMSYNVALMPTGRAYDGQPLGNKATHSDHGDHNYTRASVVFVGNYETAKPTEDQIDTAARLLAQWKRDGTITRLKPRLHRDTKSTACPGKHVVAARKEIHRRARAYLKGENSVMLTKKVKAWLRQHVSPHADVVPYRDPYSGGKHADPKNKKLSVAWALDHLLRRGARTEDNTRKLLARQGAMQAAMDKQTDLFRELLSGHALPPDYAEQVRAAAERGATDALGRIEVVTRDETEESPA